jgi:hypothetical protein
MRGSLVALLILAVTPGAGWTREAPARGLDIYFIDTEGGAATLLVSPAGEYPLCVDRPSKAYCLDNHADRSVAAAAKMGKLHVHQLRVSRVPSRLDGPG